MKLAERDSSRSITALVFAGSIVISAIVVSYITKVIYQQFWISSQGTIPAKCMIG